jgi:hypothetical protein
LGEVDAVGFIQGGDDVGEWSFLSSVLHATAWDGALFLFQFDAAGVGLLQAERIQVDAVTDFVRQAHLAPEAAQASQM